MILKAAHSGARLGMMMKVALVITLASAAALGEFGELEGSCDASCGTCETLKHVVAEPCDDGSASQHDWSTRHATTGGIHIVSRSDPRLCLGWNAQLGLLAMSPCEEEAVCQVFVYDSDGAIHAPACGADNGAGPVGDANCIDIHGKVGPQLQLTKCYGQPNDQFEFDKGQKWRCERASGQCAFTLIPRPPGQCSFTLIR